tara:strand:+ start:18233 stop:18385 length:153 start_codon:yes stop_codon:yes gene_type:complete
MWIKILRVRFKGLNSFYFGIFSLSCGYSAKKIICRHFLICFCTLFLQKKI